MKAIEEDLKLFLLYLYNKHPFYNSLLSNMNIHIENTELSKEKKIYSPEFKKIILDKTFVEKNKNKNIKEIFYLIIHEMLHMILNHPSRRESKEKERWDLASDMMVDTIINEDPILKKLLSFNYETRFTSKNTTEEIYLKVEKMDPLRRPKGEENHDQWEKSSEENYSEDIKDMILEAAQLVSETKVGEIPSFLSETIDKLTHSKTDIKEYINNIVNEFIDFSYSYKRGDRRYLYNNLIVPSLIEDIKHFKLLFYIDTSYSMNIKGLTETISEIVDLVFNLESFEITIIQSDTEIKNIVTITENDFDIKDLIEIKGRGGTDLKPLFSYLEDEENTFDLVIVNTDFYINQQEIIEYKKLEEEIEIIALLPKEYNELVNLKNAFYLES